MKDFRNLTVWDKGHQLTLEAYKVTAKFPREEQYGLTSQIRRCCASIPANIAEGCGRRGNAEFHRFLQIASGSASELDYHFLLSHDLGFLSDSDLPKTFAVSAGAEANADVTNSQGGQRTFSGWLNADPQVPIAKC